MEFGIICPHCGNMSNGKIVDTRPTMFGKRRRRLCEHCGKRFTTIENCVAKQRNYTYKGVTKDESKQTR